MRRNNSYGIGMDIFSEQCTVRFGDVDTSNTLTLASTFMFLQEAAINHAEILGVGRNALQQAGQVWVLSRISVCMERRPVFGEKLTVRTWPRGLYKLFAVRDYDILGEDGKTAVRGRSGWLILDIEKRRPLRPDLQGDRLPLNEGLNAMPVSPGSPANETPGSLAVRPEFTADSMVARTPRAACYSDIDYNGHMNNTRYIQWIQDLFAPDVFDKARQIRLDINYLSEVPYGQTVELFSMPLEADSALPCAPEHPLAAFAIEGKAASAPPQTDGTSVFRAELRTGM